MLLGRWRSRITGWFKIGLSSSPRGRGRVARVGVAGVGSVGVHLDGVDAAEITAGAGRLGVPDPPTEPLQRFTARRIHC